MKRSYIFLVILTALSARACFADEAEKGQVMIMGTFHFANPGLDTVKTDQMNVMTPENQAYLDGFARRVADFSPTHILIECRPKDTAAYNERLGRYLAGEYDLPSNENYQIGFRVARQAKLVEIICYDEREIGWDGEPLAAYMPSHAPAIQAERDALIADFVSRMTKDHQTKSLKALLLQSNDPAEDALNKYFYLMTNEVGAGENFVGADAAASWWHRNFRMYANIQKHAQNGSRVLAVAGQGHAAILKDLLALDQSRTAIDVRPYF
jgi:hypothetical protein